MSQAIAYPTFVSMLCQGVAEVGRSDLGSLHSQLSSFKKLTDLAQAALQGTDYDIETLCDAVDELKRLQKFPKLITHLCSVRHKCLSRGRLTRTIYTLKLFTGGLKCVKVVGQAGVPHVATVAAMTSEITVPAFGFIAEFTFTVSVGGLANFFSVSATCVSIVRDLNKLFELEFCNTGLSREEVRLLRIENTVHLAKCSLKVGQVALICMGVASPALSVTLVLVAIGLDKSLQMVRTQAFADWCNGCAHLKEGALTPVNAA
ncbi:MAG: hypothetical protein KDK48_06420 [Chlamydiia bacterium]|nr:hypothetical protein [Chlamydiia bacterium]